MVLVNLQSKTIPDVRDALIKWFHSVLPDTRSYEGCSEVNACDFVGIRTRWKLSVDGRARLTMTNILRGEKRMARSIPLDSISLKTQSLGF